MAVKVTMTTVAMAMEMVMTMEIKTVTMAVETVTLAVTTVAEENGSNGRIGVAGSGKGGMGIGYMGWEERVVSSG